MEDDVNTVFGAAFGADSDDEGEKTLKKEEREKRTFQSEEDFLQQKKEFVPKVETRDVLPHFTELNNRNCYNVRRWF